MPPIVVASLIAAGGAVGGAAIAAHASGKAADQEQQANNKALDLQQQQFGRAQTALAPFQPGAGIYQPLQAPVTNQAAPGSTLGGLRSYGQPAMPPAGAPTVGMRKTFPNGATGVWDGKGWLQQ